MYHLLLMPPTPSDNLVQDKHLDDDPDHLYSDINLLKRESLKFHPEVKRLKQQLWELTLEFGRANALLVADHTSSQDNTIDAQRVAQPAYSLLHHKIVLAVLGNAVDPADEASIIDEDWKVDMAQQRRRNPKSDTM